MAEVLLALVLWMSVPSAPASSWITARACAEEVVLGTCTSDCYLYWED